MLYTPDRWVLLEIEPYKLYKVLAGWNGGYLSADEWRINSGIKSLTDEGQYFTATGHSGSEYRLYKDAEGFNKISADVLYNLQNAYPHIVTVSAEQYFTRV